MFKIHTLQSTCGEEQNRISKINIKISVCLKLLINLKYNLVSFFEKYA